MPEPTIKQRLSDAIKQAMKAGEKERLGALRQIHAAIKQREVDERTELDDAATLAVLDKLAKQYRESLEQYEAAGRDDLVRKERAELDVLAEFLPQPLGDDEIERLVDEAIASAGAASIKDMGSVMGILKPQVQGRADMGAVSARVKARLS
ncbi:MAG: GatB/YqeY domain-containing protein [Halofilum sp. (in: g-proteobacteria)]|nr:GatB/YqeY domain-containing protein [Halofilum sp. (in: g-proteobacteria)]